MIIMSPPNLYKRIVEITTEYLGPAAKRFIDRQIINHLSKNPESITHDDLEKLIEWSRISLAYLTEDLTIVDEFSNRMASLTEIDHQKST
jgi:hypothetical protein